MGVYYALLLSKISSKDKGESRYGLAKVNFRIKQIMSPVTHETAVTTQ